MGTISSGGRLPTCPTAEADWQRTVSILAGRDRVGKAIATGRKNFTKRLQRPTATGKTLAVPRREIIRTLTRRRYTPISLAQTIPRPMEGRQGNRLAAGGGEWSIPLKAASMAAPASAVNSSILCARARGGRKRLDPYAQQLRASGNYRTSQASSRLDGARRPAHHFQAEQFR